jgi:hypothetical protein
MSSESPSPYESETELSPEIPPLPPPLSRLEFSKVNRKKLNFEEVGQLLDSPAGERKSSKGRAGPDRLKSDGGLPSQTSKLSALARGTSGKDKTPKTSTQPSVHVHLSCQTQ